jgi:Protein of unknown function (DUF2865).
MISHLRALGLVPWLGLSVGLFAAGLFAAPAAAQSPVPPAPIPGQPGAAPPPPAAEQQPPQQQPPSNPVCVRLEGQMAALNRGGGDPARAEQIKRYEDAAGKQQADLDRLVTHAKRRGCESGFFSLFTGQAPECQPLNAQIQQLRDSLDRTMSDLERLKSGNNYDQEGQRRVLLSELAQNNCGPQYRAAAAAAGPSGFLDALFGGAARIINPGGEGAPSGTFRTVCVRSCDGYYFPISYSTVQSRFADDQRTCQRECPATEAQLYTYRNPGEDMGQAVSLPARPTPRCRPPSNIARNSTQPAPAESRARAGPMRSKAPTTPRRWKAATSSSPTKMPRRCRSRPRLPCRKAPSLGNLRPARRRRPLHPLRVVRRLRPM